METSSSFNEGHLQSPKSTANRFYVASKFVDAGVEHHHSGQYDQALRSLNTALKTQRLTVGNEHLCVAHTLGNIGAVYLSLYNFMEASNALKESLDIKLRLRKGGNKAELESAGVTSIVISDTLNNLGNVAFLTNRHSEAMVYYQEALKELTIGEVPGTAVEIANALHNIGNVHVCLNEYDEGLMALTESVELLRSAYGRDDLWVADTLEKVGSIYLTLNRYDDAMNAFMEVLRITKSVLGSDHVDTGSSIYNVGMAYEGKGESRRALESFNSALEIYCKNGVDGMAVEMIRQRMLNIKVS